MILKLKYNGSFCAKCQMRNSLNEISVNKQNNALNQLKYINKKTIICNYLR